MFYDPIWDKQHEECGVLGIYDKHLDIPRYLYWGLFALQHRGQESGGIALTDGQDIHTFRGMGLISTVFANGVPDEEGGPVGIGHVRYSTTGSNNPRNIQPLAVYTPMGQLALAHNGNLTNTRALREELDRGGATFQTTMDSEIIVNLISRSQKDTIEERIMESMNRIQGAYSLVLMTKDTLYGVRDPYGFRPLCIGRTDEGGWVLASETCALDAIGAKFVRDVQPGEFVQINEKGVKSLIFAKAPRKQVCSFEYIYFARPDSVIDGQDVYQARLNMGREMWNETQYDADIVISVPDSGNTAAIGYAQASGIPFKHGLIKNRYMGRTFIMPGQTVRKKSVRQKLNAMPVEFEGKSVLLVDDSIVRGTTMTEIVRMAREAGAVKVFVASSAPRVMFPNVYGIDMPTRSELLCGDGKSAEEVAKILGADAVIYPPVEDLNKVLCDMNPSVESFDCSCFDGRYVTGDITPEYLDALDAKAAAAKTAVKAGADD